MIFNEHKYVNIVSLYDKFNGDKAKVEKHLNRKLTADELEYWETAKDQADFANEQEKKGRYITFNVPSNGW